MKCFLKSTSPFVFLSLAFLTGCGVTTPLPPVNVTIPKDWDKQGQQRLDKPTTSGESQTEAFNTLKQMAPLDKLFHSFHRAMLSNYRELTLSYLNQESMRLLYDGSRDALLPKPSIEGKFQRGSEPLPSAQKNVIGQSTNLGASVQWEIDLFGRIRSQIEAGKRQWTLAMIDHYALRQTLSHRLAITYFTLRGLQEQRKIVQQHIAVSNDTLQLVSARFQSGLTAQIDLSRAQAQLAQSRAQLPPLQEQWRSLIYEIAFLTGMEHDFVERSVEDGNSTKEFLESQWWNSATRVVPYYLPTQVLLARPDVLTADQNVLLSQANWATAKAEIFPKFLFFGQLSYGSAASMGQRQAGAAWGIGPQISWPLFDMRRIKRNSEAAQKRAHAALINLEFIVEKAMKEVQQAVCTYDELSALVKEMQEVVQSYQQVVQSSRQLYEKGVQPLTDYLRDEDQLLTASLEQVKTQAKLAMAALDYQKASGFFLLPEPNGEA
jgi:NodT family efflux transporter outer membrane factor (OMF) lipoprotein